MTAEQTATREAGRGARAGWVPGARFLSATAGPALIVGSVLGVLHDLAFGGYISAQHPDVLPQWIPNLCFLGRSLASGELPAWNPHVMAGYPFAADPQSGWMHLVAMLLHTALPCGVAIRWFIVAQPIIGGLGLFWFLRSEGLSRPAATTAGLTLALPVSGSMMLLSLPFAGMLAWTAVTLALASRYFRATSWPARLAWLAGAAIAWGQVAASHLSHGLVVGTGALVAYVVARTVSDLRGGRRGRREALLLVALLIAALPLTNLAVVLPRMAYLPRTTLGLGYEGLRELAAEIKGSSPPLRVTVAIGPSWPLMLATSPGAYLGAAALALSFGALSSRRYRPLAVAFAIFGALSYVLALKAFATAALPVVRSWPLGDFYLHAPMRFALALPLVLPVMAGLGVDAWREPGRPWRRLSMLAPAVAAWWILPPLVGADLGTLRLLALSSLPAAALLTAAVVRPALTSLIPLLLAAELAGSGLAGQAAGTEVRPSVLDVGRARPLTNMLEPRVDVAAYTRPGPIAQTLRRQEAVRFISVGRDDLGWSAYHHLQAEEFWPLMDNQRAVVFGLESVQGFNPVQLRRYWTFVRTVRPSTGISYNRAAFEQPEPWVLDLLQVGWVVGPAGDPPVEGLTPAATEGRWTLYRRDRTPPRASVHPAWSVVGSEREALEAIMSPSFDALGDVVLEEDPGLPPRGRPGEAAAAEYRALGAKRARITVDAPGPSVVLIRNLHDVNWRATVDGRPAPLLQANYLLQAVAVPGGRHAIDLEYDDPWIGLGLAGSGTALALLWGTALVLRVGRRRPSGEEPAPDPEASSAPTSLEAPGSALRP